VILILGDDSNRHPVVTGNPGFATAPSVLGCPCSRTAHTVTDQPCDGPRPAPESAAFKPAAFGAETGKDAAATCLVIGQVTQRFRPGLCGKRENKHGSG
jgi:hypothetical protein